MFNNLDEYSHPDLYDAENSDFEPDGPFFLDLSRKVGGTVLEIGCGTGRITIPLAEEGIAITGLDVVESMLKLAKQKSADLPIRWVQSDARHFDLNTTFDLIFAAASTFQHFLNRADQEAVLAQVHRHLKPQGYVAISLMFPQLPLMQFDDQQHDWFSYTTPDGLEVTVTGTDHYDPLLQMKTETAIRRWHDALGQEIVARAPLALRYFFPQEIEALLHYNRFTIVEQYGDFDRSPLTADSESIILICQKR